MGGSGRGWRWVLDPASFPGWSGRVAGAGVGPGGVGAVPWIDGKFPAPWESAHWGLVGGLESISMFSSG